MASARLATSDDEGFGLPELLVSMTMFGIVIAAAAAVFTGTIDGVRFTQTKNATTADVRIAMEAMTRSIRVAVKPEGEPSAVVSAQATAVQFYASLDRGITQTVDRPTRVTYAFNPATSCLNETQVPASNNPGADVATRPFVWTTPGKTKCLIKTFAPAAFAYFDAGTILQADQTTLVAPLSLTAAGPSLAPGQLPIVVSVQVSLNVQDPNNTAVGGVLARDRVTLGNVLAALNAGRN